jgi:hypothetical protein
LSTASDAPLEHLFSDRMLKYPNSNNDVDINFPVPAPSGTTSEPGFSAIKRQPFSANAADKIGFKISRQIVIEPNSPVVIGSKLPKLPKIIVLDSYIAEFTLQSLGGAKFNISFEAKGDLLVGVGPAVGHNTDHAVYVLAFTGFDKPNRPK